jgi:hypothetical protein
MILFLGIAFPFTLQGIRPSITASESGLTGTIGAAGTPDLTANESTRDAHRVNPTRSTPSGETYREVVTISGPPTEEPAIRYGRLYFGEVTGNGQDFRHSVGRGGGVAVCILVNREVAYARSSTASSRARDRERRTTSRRTWWQCDRLLGGMCQGRSGPSGGWPARLEATT